MRHRPAERRFAAGALHVDVDPLMIAGGFGELVDLLLGDLDPVADGHFLALQAFQFFERSDGTHGVSLLLCWPGWPGFSRG